MIKIIFFGTPEFVVPILQALLEAKDYQLAAVVSNPDRPTGRKQTLTSSPVKQWALTHKIPVLTPENLDENFKSSLRHQSYGASATIRNHKSDIGILAAYGKIIPQEIINLFPKGILVIHPSLLPAWRGASPIQASILAGEKKTGVSIIKMDEKMDHGPIVSQFTEAIKPDDTAESLYFRLFQKTAEVLITILPAWIKGEITPREQDHSQATFTKLLKKEDGYIPQEVFEIIAPKRGQTSKWKCKLGPYEIEPTAENLERFIRAMTPWPGAFTKVKIQRGEEEKRLKILKAHLLEGKLILDLVQLEGKKPVTWEEFQKGYHLLVS